jgi:RNA polymerase sigma factor (sigma-70 family)
VKGPEDRQFAKFRLTGSPRALGVVYDLVAPELLRVATHLASDPVDAEDLVQRTFVTAIEKSRDFKSNERVLSWLLGILAFHAKNEKRRSSRHPDPTRLHERIPGRPEEGAQAEELDRHLDEALAKLPED